MASILVDSSQVGSGFLHTEARLAEAINRVADVEFIPFFDEVWRCFNSHSYNAALVWTWCSVSCYMRSVVCKLGEDIFAFQYRKGKEKEKEYESLSEIKDGEFVETCKEMGILELREDSNVYDWVTSLRDRRNGLAHGKWKDHDGNSLAATPDEVVGYVCRAVEIFFKVPIDSRELAINTAKLKDFATTYKKLVSLNRAKILVEAIGDRHSMLECCHDLLTIYRTGDAGDVKNFENVRRLWRAMFQSLDKPESVIQRVLRYSAEALGMTANYSEHDGMWMFERLSDVEPDEPTAFDLLLLLRDFELPAGHRGGIQELAKSITRFFL